MDFSPPAVLSHGPAAWWDRGLSKGQADKTKSMWGLTGSILPGRSLARGFAPALRQPGLLRLVGISQTVIPGLGRTEGQKDCLAYPANTPLLGEPASFVSGQSAVVQEGAP